MRRAIESLKRSIQAVRDEAAGAPIGTLFDLLRAADDIEAGRRRGWETVRLTPEFEAALERTLPALERTLSLTPEQREAESEAYWADRRGIEIPENGARPAQCT